MHGLSFLYSFPTRWISHHLLNLLLFGIYIFLPNGVQSTMDRAVKIDDSHLSALFGEHVTWSWIVMDDSESVNRAIQPQDG